jgi:hypothetical protein
VGETAGQSLESGLALGRILLDPGSSKTPPDERSLDLGQMFENVALLVAMSIDAQCADEQVLAHVRAVEHEREIAPVVQAPAQEFGQALRRGRQKAPADRGVARRDGSCLDGLADRLEPRAP